jgi:hypothetical protein
VICWKRTGIHSDASPLVRLPGAEGTRNRLPPPRHGNNIIYVDREYDIVIAARWMKTFARLDGMVKALK